MLPVLSSSYTISKQDCKYLKRMFHVNHGLCTTCLRYFNKTQSQLGIYFPMLDHVGTHGVIQRFIDTIALKKQIHKTLNTDKGVNESNFNATGIICLQKKYPGNIFYDCFNGP